MSNKKKHAISPTREENFPLWYQEVVKLAELAENAPVRGCMVVKPWGYSIWENIQKSFDKLIKGFGVQNAYFPLFIPLSFFEKEAKHVEGFATECAVVTHHRLEKKGDKLIPASPLEEPLIVRPTSEMIIGEMFAKWVHSYRDLPLKINQWANVVRWEMRPRIFLRTSEFLWQEGHTVHASKEEAQSEALFMIETYAKFAREMLALPSIIGEKSENERFPGAESTYTIEMMMQDKKALQAGTSHFLGQNFAKAASIKFLSKDGESQLAWTTSWGTTTRLIGAIIMTHGDDDGVILPPRVSGYHLVIIPVVHQIENEEKIYAYAEALKQELQGIEYFDRNLDIFIDKRDMRSGEKNWNWIKKGVPLRIEIGLREIEEGVASVSMRTQDHKDKKSIPFSELSREIPILLNQVHRDLLERAEKQLKENIVEIETKRDFDQFFSLEDSSPGFAHVFWAGNPEIEDQIKKEKNVTIRCLPFETNQKEGVCIFTGKKTSQRVLFAKSY